MPSPRHSQPKPHEMDRRQFIAQTSGFIAGLGAALPFADLVRLGCGPHGLAVPPLPVRFLVEDPLFVYSRPCFSPTGREVMFMRAPAGSNPIATLNSNNSPWSLWTVPVHGGRPTLFFEHGQVRPTRPDWSWSTGEVVFTGIREGKAGVWTVDTTGGNSREIPIDGIERRELHYPSWYPKGDALAVTDYRSHQVLKVHLSNGTVEPLTDPKRVWAGMASVSPDSERGNPIAFAGQKPEGFYNSNDNVIWIQRTGHEAYQLDGKQGRMPWWSPDGHKVVLVSDRRREAPSFRVHPRSLPARATAFVQVVDPNGSETLQAVGVSPFDHTVAHAKWSPDGRKLVLMAAAVGDGRSGISILELEDPN